MSSHQNLINDIGLAQNEQGALIEVRCEVHVEIEVRFSSVEGTSGALVEGMMSRLGVGFGWA
jgi:hypothetical protein